MYVNGSDNYRNVKGFLQPSSPDALYNSRIWNRPDAAPSVPGNWGRHLELPFEENHAHGVSRGVIWNVCFSD